MGQRVWLRLPAWMLLACAAIESACRDQPSMIYNPPVKVEQPPLPEGVMRFDHQRAPLPDDPPVRFEKLFEVRVRADGRGFSQVAFSPDGKTLAASRSGGRPRREEIFVFDLEKQTLLHTLARPGGKVYTVAAMAFLPAGDRLASASRELERLYVWDVRKGALAQTIDLDGKAARGVIDLAAFPDGRRLLWSVYSGLYLVDLERGSAQRLPLEEHLVVKRDERPVPPHCSSVAIAADGSRFATMVSDIASFEPAILVWDASTMGVTHTIPTEGMCVGVAMAPDGKRVAAGGTKYLTVWDAVSGKPLVSGHVFAAGSPMCFSRDGKYLFAAGKHLAKGPPDDPLAVGVWDTATGRLAGSLTTDYLYCHIALSPDDTRLAVGASNIVEIYAVKYRGQADAPTDAPAPVKP